MRRGLGPQLASPTIRARPGRWRAFRRKQSRPKSLSEQAFANSSTTCRSPPSASTQKTVADMAQAGLRRIGDVALRPRAPITARFGAAADRAARCTQGAHARFDRAALSSALFLRRAALRLARSDGRGDRGVLAQARRRSRRAARAASEGGARGSSFRSTGSTAPCAGIAVGASRPLNEARAISRLFAEKLAEPDEDAIDAGFGFDLLRLACLAAEPLAPAQSEIERAHEADAPRALADLIDRLSARLGVRAVTRRDLVEAHLARVRGDSTPATWDARRGGGRHCERSEESISPAPRWIASPSARNDERDAAPSRPLRLFDRPEPIEALAEVPDGPPLRFRWRRVLHDVAAIEGPERIAPALVAARQALRPAIISAPKILKAAASGSIAKASGAGDGAREVVRARGVRVSPSPQWERERLGRRSLSGDGRSPGRTKET